MSVMQNLKDVVCTR